MTAPLIDLVDVSRIYRVGNSQVHALKNVNVTIERGEFVAIMGASGSGKSTLMAILGCLDRPTSGRYYLEGVDVARLSEPELATIRSKHLGFVFQSFNLLPRTTAIENVALPLFYTAGGPLGYAPRVKRARDALAGLGLAGSERNTPAQLSGGQQQRVAIARALINEPGLLLADEPTGNLDSRTSHEIMKTLVALNRNKGVTILLVTHESDIAAYADRILTMRDGQILSDQQKQKEAITAPVEPPVSIPNALPPTGAKLGAVVAFSTMIVATAMQALMRNRMRSALTMLGVFIGVGALIAMVAVGQGANQAVRKQIEILDRAWLYLMTRRKCLSNLAHRCVYRVSGDCLHVNLVNVASQPQLEAIGIRPRWIDPIQRSFLLARCSNS